MANFFSQHNTLRVKFEGAVDGLLPSNKPAKSGAVDAKALYNALTNKFPSDLKLPDLGVSRVEVIRGYGSPDKNGIDWMQPSNGYELYMTTYGHWGYRYPFTYLPSDMNTMKAKLLSNQYAISPTTLDDKIKLVLNQDKGAADYLMNAFHKVGYPSCSIFVSLLILCVRSIALRRR